MSNKANVYVKQGDGKGIYLFTQTKGTVLPKILSKALERGRERWGDTPSLTRIIFSEMTQREVFSNTGFGISSNLADNENFILVVDDKLERVGIFGESGIKYREYTFDSFCALQESMLEWNRLVNQRFSDDNGVNRHKKDPYPF